MLRLSCRRWRGLASPSLPRLLLSNCVKFDFSGEKVQKYFEFNRLEQQIYGWWEAAGYFQPTEEITKDPFVMTMPPPNVTGKLHVGHALFVALQDIMARYQRMRGRPTLWLPGTDHAGIATQLLVERQLQKEGTSRTKLGREEFIKRVWEFKEEHGGHITRQLRRLGASADWKREKFTLDKDMCDVVTDAFIRLYEKGLIYRGSYMVNWSPSLQSALSDLEVEFHEEEGVLYYFRYELEDDQESKSSSRRYIAVATTRPETILGDTAVCVHPDDPRYKDYIGKKVVVPFSGGRSVPVISDSYVDMNFGTGALKITPAHDENDYNLGIKHQLPTLMIMNKDGTMNDLCGKYTGLDRFECRKRLWSDMMDSGLGIEAKKHIQRIPRSQRSGEIIEPLLSEQWFVKMEGMAGKALQVVRNKNLRFVPDRFEKVWFGWLENIHDWCVSRQLWWGHRIPVYYLVNDKSKWVVAKDLNEARAKALQQFGENHDVIQDDDVLDTWFSSGLWPFSTLGWPDLKASDYQKFYPTAVLETGYDILFFWVARMVMMGIEFTGKSPFHTVYLHGIIRDSAGEKMSKTKGNVVDPILAIEEYGCDALRSALVQGTTAGQDVLLDMERVKIQRNFVNKLWNVGKYIDNSLGNLSKDIALSVSRPLHRDEISSFPLAERYICSRCHEVSIEVTNLLEAYLFMEALKSVSDFIWDEYADWYLEISKTRAVGSQEYIMSRRVLVYVWDTSLRLLHPFMPFITETLWQMIPHQGNTLMLSSWPVLEGQDLNVDAVSVQSFNFLQSIVRSIRNTRAEYSVEGKKKIDVTLLLRGESARNYKEILLQESNSLCTLAKIEHKNFKIEILPEVILSERNDEKSIRVLVNENCEIVIPMSSMVDVTKEKNRISSQITKLRAAITPLQQRLQSDGFISKASPQVVEEVRATLQEKEEQLRILEERLALYQ